MGLPRLMLGGLLAIAGMLLPAMVAAKAAWTVLEAPAGAGLRDVVLLDGAAHALREGGGLFRVSMANGKVVVADRATRVPAEPSRPGMLTDGEVVRGTRQVRTAWLTGESRAYRHGVLGDHIEATGLAVELNDGRRLEYKLPQDSVFEDRYPRLVDLDRDGRDELLVVRTYLQKGGALMLFSAGPGGLKPIAEMAPLGRRHRWLNPIGVADFDGDGRLEVAAVEKPHLDGILRVFALEGSRLVGKYQSVGFSNHANGSRVLHMSAVLDMNDDGVPDIVVPSLSRNSLRMVSFSGGGLLDMGGLRQRAEIVTGMVTADLDGDRRPEIVYGLADGTVVVLTRQQGP